MRAEADDARDRGRRRDETRRLAGRVMARRDMGKLVFLDLVDRSGRIQLLCPAARTGEVDVHLGDVDRRHRKADEEPPRRAVAHRRRARAALAHPLAAPGHVPRADRRRAALPPPLPRPADERGDARRLHPPLADGQGDPRLPRRRRVPRGRDARAAGATTAARSRGRSPRTRTSSTRTSTCASPAASSTSSG